MSRHSQLPPQCPLQKKFVAPQDNPPPSCKDIELLHSKKLGDCILDEQPAWFNDLLSDSDGASGESNTLCNNSVPFSDQLNETETVDSCEPDDDDGLGSSYTYGPNSPRRKNKPEKEMMSAFSEYVTLNTLSLLDGYTCVSGVRRSESFGTSEGEINTQNKQIKCHLGQRSRARKHEYIAELEKTVDIIQNLGSDLAVRVASLKQHHNALSLENNTLKQLLLRTNQEKLIADGEYQSLKKEAERLKIFLAGSSNNKNRARTNSGSDDHLAHHGDIWNMLDMQKLYLN